MNMCVCVDVCVCHHCFNGLTAELGARMSHSFANHASFRPEFANELLSNVDSKHTKTLFQLIELVFHSSKEIYDAGVIRKCRSMGFKTDCCFCSCS